MQQTGQMNFSGCRRSLNKLKEGYIATGDVEGKDPQGYCD